MSRPKSILRPRPLTIHLPGDVATRLQLYLTSPILGRPPQGAYQKFFTDRINEFFARMAGTVDLEHRNAEPLLAALTPEEILENEQADKE